MSDEKRAREERRKKIRELEASLFGMSPIDTSKVDVPKLKNVDEYADKFEKAERQKRFQPKNVESFFPTFKTSNKTSLKRSNVKNDDKNHLLSDDEDDVDDDYFDDDKYDAVKSLSKVNDVLTNVLLFANLICK